MSDLLSAASLLLAVLGVLYGLWYPEIIAALEIKVPIHVEDRQGPYHKVTTVFYSRALPLTIASIGVSLIFLPDAVKISLDSIFGYSTQGILYLYSYSATHTAFCFVVAMSITIASHLTVFSIKLIRLRKKLAEKENSKNQ